ncbi:MAG: sterol desaturase family protein, partial [Burkholderiales bacterium]
VLAFRYPEYLTTPELRRHYPVELLRQLLFAALVLAGSVSLANAAFGRTRWLNGAAFAIVLMAVVLGGHRVPVGEFADGTPYLGVDWFVLDLLGSALVFVLVEKALPLRPGQPLFRADWQTDLGYFAVNHLAVGLLLLATNALVHAFFGWAVHAPLQQTIRSLPWWTELPLLILVADFVQYWVHRAWHRVPALWRIHAVHHSIGALDWLAGSRMHLLDMLATRVLVLGAIFVLGFSRWAIDVYVVIVGFHAVLNHANVRLPWGPLRHVLVTPEFHHWHHASDRQALDRNFAAHFPFLDRMFGTLLDAPQELPWRYGVLGEALPRGFLRQQLHPFRRGDDRGVNTPA